MVLFICSANFCNTGIPLTLKLVVELLYKNVNSHNNHSYCFFLFVYFILLPTSPFFFLSYTFKLYTFEFPPFFLYV
ncbi:hypothetical protein BDF21DRAFT_419153 [Thamnidium elegans]|nr:hypothetical protein BDF21DRAFT_419153 [Thamnidium elegans]